MNLREGEDYYVERGLLVLTIAYHRMRGHGSALSTPMIACYVCSIAWCSAGAVTDGATVA